MESHPHVKNEPRVNSQMERKGLHRAAWSGVGRGASVGCLESQALRQQVGSSCLKGCA